MLIVTANKKKNYSNLLVPIINAIEKNYANREEWIFWMTMINRITPNYFPKLILNQEEIYFIDTVDYKVNEGYKNTVCKKVIPKYIKKL